MHRLLSLDDYASAIASVSAVRSSISDSFISVVCKYSVASIASLYSQFDAVREVFELEFRYFGFFLFDQLGGLATESP